MDYQMFDSLSSSPLNKSVGSIHKAKIYPCGNRTYLGNKKAFGREMKFWEGIAAEPLVSTAASLSLALSGWRTKLRVTRISNDDLDIFGLENPGNGWPLAPGNFRDELSAYRIGTTFLPHDFQDRGKDNKLDLFCLAENVCSYLR